MITEKMTSTKMTPGQRKQLLRVVEDAIDSFDPSKDQINEVLKVGNLFQLDVKASLAKLSITDKRFGPAVKDFQFTVPVDYNHDTQIDTFAEKTKGLPTTYFFNDDLTSNNFAKATNKLEPGKTYRVKIFPILERVTSEDCVMFLRKQGAILVGGHGVTLLQSEKADQFPVGKWTVSFDKKEALLYADGGRRVPCVGASSDGDFDFVLGYFEGDWDDSFCLLCLCDL